MKKLVRTLSISVGIAIVLTLLGSSESRAVVGFGNRDFKGTYALGAQQCCVIGQFTADGAGNMTGSITLAGGGDVHHESLACTYVVASNGTGTMTCTTVKLDGDDIGDTATGTNDFVLADGGKELFSISTDVGGEIEGLVTIAKRQ